MEKNTVLKYSEKILLSLFSMNLVISSLNLLLLSSSIENCLFRGDMRVIRIHFVVIIHIGGFALLEFYLIVYLQRFS